MSISGETVAYVQVCGGLCSVSGCMLFSNRAKPFKRRIQAGRRGGGSRCDLLLRCKKSHLITGGEALPWIQGFGATWVPLFKVIIYLCVS